MSGAIPLRGVGRTTLPYHSAAKVGWTHTHSGHFGGAKGNDRNPKGKRQTSNNRAV